VVELSGKATLGKLAAAIEACQTPHMSQTPPEVLAILPGKAPEGATCASLLEKAKNAVEK
jgi:hypothetical protein